jgi:hypothetical protein
LREEWFVKFRRRATDDAVETGPGDGAAGAEDPTTVAGRGPHDSTGVTLEEGAYADLGSLWFLPLEERELRLQVDESTGAVASVLVVGQDGALELRAFAAPRHGSMWDQVRPQIAEDVASQGGEVTEEAGPHGPELVANLRVQLPDGREGEQRMRMLGIDGPRWFLRATFHGAPAVSEAASATWLEVLDKIVVHRGTEAMPPGEALPVHVPGDARRLD